MKTKITTLLMVSVFFLSALALADGHTPTKTKAKPQPDCGCGDPTDDSNIIDYILSTWWIDPQETLPDNR